MVAAKTSVLALAAAAAAFVPLSANAYQNEGLGYAISNEERAMNAPYFDELKKRFGPAPARVVPGHANRFAKRQSSAAAAPTASSSGLASSGAVVGASLSMGTIPIGVSTTAQPTSALPTTYAAGATPSIRGASPLPAVVINPAEWPSLDHVPDVNSAQVQQWMSQIDWSKVPDIPVTQLGGCQNASNAAAVQNASANGWWTCGSHTRSSDVVACPEKNTWGMSFDDGPSPDTPRLLDYLVQHDLKSTFFVVGSRVISRPEMLQYEYMSGNQISVHTWSHPFLTTKTNAEIVAELGWTKEAIRRVTGVTPNTMRPPYGDIDDRVRSISLMMGLTPIIWTTFNGATFDTFDWQIAGGVVNADTVLQRFETIINSTSQMDTGFIVLAHDLYQQSTSLAIDYVLPYALSRSSLKIEPIFQCLGQSLSDVYIETAPNATSSGSAATGAATTLDRGSSARTTGLVAANANGKSSGNTGAGSQLAIPAFTVILAAAAAYLL